MLWSSCFILPLTHTQTPSHFPNLHPLTNSTGIMPYHRNLVPLSQLVPSSEKMLIMIAEPILLQGHCDSLMAHRITKNWTDNDILHLKSTLQIWSALINYKLLFDLQISCCILKCACCIFMLLQLDIFQWSKPFIDSNVSSMLTQQWLSVYNIHISYIDVWNFLQRPRYWEYIFLLSSVYGV